MKVWSAAARFQAANPPNRLRIPAFSVIMGEQKTRGKVGGDPFIGATVPAPLEFAPSRCDGLV